MTEKIEKGACTYLRFMTLLYVVNQHTRITVITKLKANIRKTFSGLNYVAIAKPFKFISFNSLNEYITKFSRKFDIALVLRRQTLKSTILPQKSFLIDAILGLIVS